MRILFSFHLKIFLLLSLLGSLSLKALEAKYLKSINLFEEKSPLNPTVGFLWLQGTLENFLELPHENKKDSRFYAVFLALLWAKSSS